MNTCTRLTDEKDPNSKCGKDCDLLGGWCDDCKNKHYDVSVKRRPTYEEAKKGLERAAQRVKKYNAMSLKDLNDELMDAEAWLHDNPTHAKIEEAKARYGHMRMIWNDRMEEANKQKDYKAIQEGLL